MLLLLIVAGLFLGWSPVFLGVLFIVWVGAVWIKSA